MNELTLNSKFDKPVCLALGFFDSVHLGHRGLINRAKEVADNAGAELVVVTFSNNAYKQFNPDGKLIYCYDERLILLSAMGVKYVLPFHFDRSFKEISKDEFLKNLSSAFNIKAFVCGYDYMFGAGGKGDSEYLKAYCEKSDIICEVVNPIMVDGIRVSSSMIKKLLNDGRVKDANKFLSVPYFMFGKVVGGRGVGHTFGMPTANLAFLKDKLIIQNGVYATKTVIDGQIYKSVTNVGAKPTFQEMSVTVETLIKDYDGDLYGKDIKLEFYEYLRPILKFATPHELSKQVHSDLEWQIKTDKV